jgi:hypothetical protein
VDKQRQLTLTYHEAQQPVHTPELPRRTLGDMSVRLPAAVVAGAAAASVVSVGREAVYYR